MKKIISVEKLAKTYCVPPAKDYDELIENAEKQNELNGRPDVGVPPYILEIESELGTFKFYFYKKGGKFNEGYINFPEGIDTPNTHDKINGGIKSFVSPKDALDYLLKKEENHLINECISAIISAGKLELEKKYNGSLKMIDVGYSGPNYGDYPTTGHVSDAVGLLNKRY